MTWYTIHGISVSFMLRFSPLSSYEIEMIYDIFILRTTKDKSTI